MQLALNKTTISYGVFVVFWFLSYLFFQDTSWGLVEIDKYAHYFLMLSVLVFAIQVVSGKARSAKLASLLPVFISAYFYAAFFMPVIESIDMGSATEKVRKMQVKRMF